MSTFYDLAHGGDPHTCRCACHRLAWVTSEGGDLVTTTRSPAPMTFAFPHAPEAASLGTALADHCADVTRAAMEACAGCSGQHRLASGLGSAPDPFNRSTLRPRDGWTTNFGEGPE